MPPASLGCTPRKRRLVDGVMTVTLNRPERKNALSNEAYGGLADAIERSEGQDAARLKGEKRSGMRVHARTGLPCPVCGDVVREVSFAERSFQYCATCQTGGKPLADRRMSKLLK